MFLLEDKLDKFDIPTKEKAEEMLAHLANEQYHIGNIERKKQQRKRELRGKQSRQNRKASFILFM